MILHAFTDGASRGNPGESGFGIVVKDDRGSYRVRNKGLKRYHARFQELKKSLPFDIHILHIGREKNKDADRLANEAIDARISPSG